MNPDVKINLVLIHFKYDFNTQDHREMFPNYFEMIFFRNLCFITIYVSKFENIDAYDFGP